MEENQGISEATLQISDPETVLRMFGPQDQNLRQIKQEFGVSITHRAGLIKISGSPEAVRSATDQLERYRNPAAATTVVTSVPLPSEPHAKPSGPFLGAEKRELAIHHPTLRIVPRTEGQARYVETIRQHDMTFCIGPAGCGKTYLAVAMAVEAFKTRQVRKIVLVRPAVEAGESLGFLPGDLQAKLNPYLRPLLDAIHDMMGFEQAKYLMEQEVIEVVPLAYMRGRTLNHAFIILDEAQNTTVAQMKMFLTRMGEGAKMVISGDISQIDLPHGVTSGLRDSVQRLKGIPGIGFSKLQEADIVRHALVHRIVKAYEHPSQPSGYSPSGGMEQGL